jgi:hypothetical protein
LRLAKVSRAGASGLSLTWGKSITSLWGTPGKTRRSRKGRGSLVMPGSLPVMTSSLRPGGHGTNGRNECLYVIPTIRRQTVREATWPVGRPFRALARRRTRV